MNMVEVGTEMIKQLQKLHIGETLLVKHQSVDDYTVLVNIGKALFGSHGIRYQCEVYDSPQGTVLRGLLTLTEQTFTDVKLEVGSEVIVSNDEITVNLVVQEVLGRFDYVAHSVGQVTFRETKTTEC